MLPALLITLREGLEAALIVGITLSLLRKLGHQQQSRSVWYGVGAAALASIGVGLGLNALGLAFEGRGEEIFEGIMMLTAAGVLTWVILWMRRQGRQVQARLQADVREAVITGGRWALFTLAFVAVVREGIETALFMTATMMSASPLLSLFGGLLGLALAVALGWLIFAAGTQLNVGAFFGVTSAILLIVAAGLTAHGVHELQEAAVVPTIVEHIWNINHIVDEDGPVGVFLKALVGYNGNPSLLEVVVYAAYLLMVGLVGQGADTRWLRPKSADA